MPIVSVQNGVRLVRDGLLVTDDPGAPCCCGCVEGTLPECIRITLEIVESAPGCGAPDRDPVTRPNQFSVMPPSGSFYLERSGGGNEYTRLESLSLTGAGTQCGEPGLWDVSGLGLTATLGCVRPPGNPTADPEYGLSLDEGDNRATWAIQSGQFLDTWFWGNGHQTDSNGVAYPDGQPRHWEVEGRPGAASLRVGEYALGPPLNPNAADEQDVRYRLSWEPATCPGPDPQGACCLPDGSCSQQTEAGCLGLGGAYAGDDVACIDADCPQPLGACCPTSGECFDNVPESACPGSGTWYAGLDCADVTCTAATGACCLPDGGCVDGLTAAQCFALSSRAKFNKGVGCLKVACLPTEPRDGEGACCLRAGPVTLCVYQSEVICRAKGGTYIGGICSETLCGGVSQALTAGDFF